LFIILESTEAVQFLMFTVFFFRNRSSLVFTVVIAIIFCMISNA